MQPFLYYFFLYFIFSKELQKLEQEYLDECKQLEKVQN